MLFAQAQGEVPSGHLRQRNLGHYAKKMTRFRYVHEIMSESDSDDDPARVAWRLFRGDDGKGEVSNEDTVKSVSALDRNYREGLFPVTLSTKGDYCLRVFRGDGTEFAGYSTTTNTVSLIERKQKFTGSLFNFWSLNDDDKWETISSEIVSSVYLYKWEVGLDYDCFKVQHPSGETYWDSVEYWKSNGTCKDSEFYHLSSKIEDPTEVVGLVKLIYAPAVSKSSEEVKRDFLAAVDEISEPGATSCRNFMRDEALKFYCLEMWYKSTSTMIKYLTMIVGHSGSLTAIAAGKTLSAMLQLISEVIWSTAKKVFGIPSYVDVMNIVKNHLDTTYFKILQPWCMIKGTPIRRR